MSVKRNRHCIYRIVKIILALVFFRYVYITLQHKNLTENTSSNNKVVQHQEDMKDRLHRKFLVSIKQNRQLGFDSKKIFNDGSGSFLGKLLYNSSVKKFNESEFLQMLQERTNGATDIPLDLNNTQVCDENNVCKSVAKYFNWKAETYIRLVNSHLQIQRSSPTILSYPEDMLRPNPLIMVKDATMSIDYSIIHKELQKDKERRLKLGDDDLLKIARIQTALSLEDKNLVPNIMHFIWFGCRKFRIHHYMSILSAWRYQKPSLILFHTNCVPQGAFWNSIQNITQSSFIIIRRTPPKEVFGKAIKKVEHQSDVARLQILLEIGGMYIDDDILILKSFDDLRVNKMVLAEENYDALGNGIILTQKNSWFLSRWFQEYQSFNDSRWSDSSCFVPWSMWRLFPTTVFVVKEKMLRPNWEEIYYIYRELWDWRKSYTIHLYSRYMKQVDGYVERSIQELSVLNTTYGEVARHIIWGDYRIRNPAESYNI